MSTVRAALVLLLALPNAAAAQGTIAGRVQDGAGRPVPEASVRARFADEQSARETVTDSAGAFRLTALAPGSWTITVRKVGYRSAEQRGVRVSDGRTVELEVVLTRAPRQLSEIRVVASPTAVDVTVPELSTRLDRSFTALLPGGRTASSLIALIPGARNDQLWGGAPGVSNNYQLDGVAMNHPGLGGDYLQLSVDWIEALEVRGLGAGAEHGNFQGGVIDARTRTGSNEARRAMRANYESPALTSSNFNLHEDGVEQAGRREVAGEALGPIARDRLFYFAAGQYVSRDLRSPNLATPAMDFQPFEEAQTDARGLGKLTWLPALGHRVDLLAGISGHAIARAGINGIDDASATHRVRRPVGYASLAWERMQSRGSRVRARVGGFTARETREGYRGQSVPGVQLLQLGRQPAFQNAAFDERREPTSVNATLTWQTTRQWLAEHQFLLGVEALRARWRDERTRNGGVTWRPYSFGIANFDPTDAGTWQVVGSDWGGDIRIDSDIGSEALFVEDRLALGRQVTVTGGVRVGWWRGFILPSCAAADTCSRFEAVRSTGIDPRLGAVWDVTGRGTFAVKAHLGRYHQGMHALFFDRVSGANVYGNHRFYNAAPRLAASDVVFTEAQRDAPGSGFSEFYDETILDISGRVDGFRQPHVDQAVLAIEKSVGDRWKVEALYTHRRNGDIVGLVDRNLEDNYTPIHDVSVDHRLQRGLVLAPDGSRLVLPVIYASNADIREILVRYRGNETVLWGYPIEYLRGLTWNPDVVLTAVPSARRVYDQATLALRTVQPSWRAEGSLTGARLRGNVPGVAGYGTTATRFTAGPFVNPNEGINASGDLPDALQMEAKVWAIAHLPRHLEGGLLYTHTLGERFTPSVELLGRYVYSDSAGIPFPATLFRHAQGQQILLEPRGSRTYASRGVLDAHLAWRAPRGLVVTMDLFNVLGENALLSVETVIRERDVTDPSSFFGAARRRVAPRTLRIGMRLEGRLQH